jgi:hypothetical protein
MTTYNNQEDLFDALTRAVLAGQRDLDAVAGSYSASSSVWSWLRLIELLHNTLVPERPSRRYVSQLRQELMGQPLTVIDRVRYLPPRVQIAAGIALVAGFALIARSRVRLPDAGTGASVFEVPSTT